MHNQMVFNRGSFNVPFDDTLVILQTDAFETISGMFGVAVVAYLDTNASESVQAQCNVNAGIKLVSQSVETISASCTAIGTVLMSTQSSENISAQAALGASISLSAAMTEAILAQTSLGAEHYIQMSAREEINADIAVACMVFPPVQNAYEIISAVCNLEAVDIIEITIDVTINPGQTLVIDSDGYVVLLDGQNIVDKHEGRWLKLDRLIRSVQIGTGSNAELQSSILYTERWW